jgi:hypothetical protein
LKKIFYELSAPINRAINKYAWIILQKVSPWRQRGTNVAQHRLIHARQGVSLPLKNAHEP